MANTTASAIDPVCGMTVDTSNSQCSEHGGESYYFCCKGCQTRFENDPEGVLAARAEKVGKRAILADLPPLGEIRHELFTPHLQTEFTLDRPGTTPVTCKLVEIAPIRSNGSPGKTP